MVCLVGDESLSAVRAVGPEEGRYDDQTPPEKKRRRRQRPKKSEMEDTYPAYLQVATFWTNARRFIWQYIYLLHVSLC